MSHKTGAKLFLCNVRLDKHDTLLKKRKGSGMRQAQALVRGGTAPQDSESFRPLDLASTCGIDGLVGKEEEEEVM